MVRWILLCLLCVSSQLYAQNSTFLQQYCSKVKEYNQDIKAAHYAVAAQQEKEKSAKANFLPSLSGNANVGYTGNPLELSVDIPGVNESLEFHGRNTKYGASLTLAQPIYSGGAIRANYEKAKRENEISSYERERIINNILYDANVYYWNKVARQEMVGVAEEFKQSVSALVEVVKHRVEQEYSDRNDLLMAEVKLNDAEYRLIQAQNEAEIARLSMNSFSGAPFDEVIPTDSLVIPLKEDASFEGAIENVVTVRPETKMAISQVEVQKSAAKIANAQYLPQLSFGIDGSYSSPGYDFKADLDPNYVVYAKLSVPIFEWGKRRNTRKIGKYSISMAIENQLKTIDNVRLEIKTAFYAYSQAVEKVQLTENSLIKASESEKMAMGKYIEGQISIVEVINAQLYHQEAKVNYIQSKLNAQIAKSAFDRAVGRIDNL